MPPRKQAIKRAVKFLLSFLLSGSLVSLIFANFIITPPEEILPPHARAAKIIVYKAARKMKLLDDQMQVLKTYKISLGKNPIGAKKEEGDRKTPEGDYQIISRNEKSAYYKALKISYPNSDDIAQAKKRGVSAGGMIMIHGLPNGLGWVGKRHRSYSTWTAGCIAVTNEEIDEIWAAVPDGTPITINP